MKEVACAMLLAAAANAAEDRITAPVDASQRVRLSGHAHPAAVAANDRGALDPAAELAYVTLMLKPAAGLEAFLAEQQNPSSPEYHRWLTPEQFADRFGLSGNDMAKVAGWLRSEGLAVNDVARGRHWITFTGKAEAVGQALHTSFRRYESGGRMHFSNTSAPEVPAALAGVVEGFAGLDDFDLKPLSVKSDFSPETNAGNSHFLVPDDVATIYNFAPLYKAGIDGSGQKIAVVGRTDISLADIRAFRRRFNLPAGDPQTVLFGPDPGANSLADLEEAELDLEWAGAIAPKATIVYVNSRSVNTSLQYAVDRNLAPVVSMSYGGCELTAQPGFRAIAQQANAQGITWIAASGDWGSATCDGFAPNQQASKGLTADFPASIPEVTAIGGTTFNEGTGNYWAAANGPNLGSALSYIPEVVWNDSAARHELASSGGGASEIFTKPVWQTGPGVPNDGARDVPDVSFAASPNHDGYEVVVLNNLLAFGGTSVGTPIFAGIVALLNQHVTSQGGAAGLGNVNPMLYRLAQSATDVFHDIQDGDNKVACVQGTAGCVDGALGNVAGPGYDLTTGLGSVDANNLVMKWLTGTASTTTISANPGTFAIGDKIQLTATVTGAGTIAPTGTVTFISNDVVLGKAALGSGPVTATGDGLIVAGGNGTITAHYSGDAVYNASGASTTVTLKLPASGSLVVPSVAPNPVFEGANAWPYTLRLEEKAGVATKLTAFTINGVNNLSAFSSTAIPAHGILIANLAGLNLNPPVDRVFHFAGADANGRQWSQDLTVPFVGPAGRPLIPAITLTSIPKTVERDPSNHACPFEQKLVLEEASGMYELIAAFSVGKQDLTPAIQQIFGTDRLAPFGVLEGTICWPANSSGAKNYEIAAVSEFGTLAQASVDTTLSGVMAAAAAEPVVTPRIVEILSDITSRGGSGAVSIDFGAAAQWTASIFPARAANWLAVSPRSGSGKGQITLQASGAALSNGVYDATVVIQSGSRAVSVRVAFVLGRSFTTAIDKITNAASENPVAAPGAMVRLTGSNLAPSSRAGSIVLGALSLTLNGVSATVNGISAPLYSIAPGALTIQIPYETGLGTAVVGVNNNGQIASYLLTMETTAPELFRTAPGFLSPNGNARQGQTIAAFITGEGDVMPFLATGGTPPAGTPAKNLPAPGLPVTVEIGDTKAAVTFVGVAPGLVGVTQINFTVPARMRVGLYPVAVTVGGVASSPASLRVMAAK